MTITGELNLTDLQNKGNNLVTSHLGAWTPSVKHKLTAFSTLERVENMLKPNEQSINQIIRQFPNGFTITEQKHMGKSKSNFTKPKMDQNY